MSIKRPIFHSEADFQHALAWEIQELYPESNIRLEKRVDINNISMYFDIFITLKNNIILIETKYKTKKLKINFENEEFILKTHSAYDSNRYEILKDVSRIETYLNFNKNGNGFTIFLTNDLAYLKMGIKKESNDKDFKIHEGRTISGNLMWKEGTSNGTMKNKESPILLINNYNIHWRDYSNLNMKDGEFKYLMLEIKY